MGKTVKIKTVVDFPALRISDQYDEEVDDSCRQAAILGRGAAQAGFLSKYQGLEPDRHVQHVLTSFEFWDSRYEDGGWLYGVAGSPVPEPGTKGGWENTLGGRAHFFEYGRSAPGYGRESGMDPTDVSSSRRLYRIAGGNDQAQPPRPYMRPTIGRIGRKFNGITKKRLKRLAKKLNQRVK